MKYKIKEIDVLNISFAKSQLNNGTIVNVKYNNNSLEFQSPKMRIHSISNETGFIVLKVNCTQACKTFYLKILEIEAHLNKKLENSMNESVFHENYVTVKVPFKNSNPLIKVFKDESLFNYFHLSTDMEIICMLSIDKVWINNFNEANYHLIVKEIMVTN